jgi:hypothetical protein
MTVETASWINEFDPDLPAQTDLKREGPQHMRMTKQVLQNTFPNFGTAAPVNATPAELNFSVGVTSAIQTQLNTLTAAKAAKAGDTYTGAHDFTGATLTAATQAPSDATNKVATMAALAAASFSSALPGQAGNERKWIKTNGTDASWQYLSLDTETITANTVAVPGKFYVIATADITLTIPATFNANEPVGFGMSRGITRAYVDWTTNKLKGRDPGVMELQSQNDAATVTFANATDGFVEV